MEAQTPLIYKTISEVMKKINAIAKGRKNQQQGFNFRGIDDVMNELHPVMAECGLFVVPTVLEENRTQGTTRNGATMFYTRLKIEFTFYAQDGSNIKSIVIGEAMDSGDKASNKALSIGLKYAMLQVFCIPTEDEKDPDATTHSFDEMKPVTKTEQKKMQKAPPAQKPQPAGPAGGPDTPDEHREINSILGTMYEDNTKIFSNQDCQRIGTMRQTMTARDVINWLRDELNHRGQAYAQAHQKPAESQAITPEQEEELYEIF